MQEEGGPMAETIKSSNPFDPADLVAEVEPASAAAVETALEAALEAQLAWAADAMLRSRSLTALGEAVESRRDQFAELMVREVGKPVAEAEGEVERALAILRFYSQVALDPDGETLPGSTPGARVVVRREPLGVILAICPWNFPLAIPLWKAAPALAYGNSVLIKPAGPAIATAALLQQCVAEALPQGVLAGLVMPGSQTGALLDDERIAAVTFTGSTGTGISVAERLARRAAPAQAEMGGQNPAIVLADADLDAAAAAIVGGAMGYAGQKCTATRRVSRWPRSPTSSNRSWRSWCSASRSATPGRPGSRSARCSAPGRCRSSKTRSRLLWRPERPRAPGPLWPAVRPATEPMVVRPPTGISSARRCCDRTTWRRP